VLRAGGGRRRRRRARGRRGRAPRRRRDASALRTVILDAIESANRAVVDLGTGVATTLAVVEINAGSVRPYHVGDSMILVVGQRGRIKLQTVSHSPVGFAVEAGVLDEREAMHHQDRHLVSNVVGAPNMRIEVGSALPLAARDTVLLASDGLSDNLHTREIADRIRVGRLGVAADRLAREARRRMGTPASGEPSKPDDLTVVGFRRLP
jgi:serine/threonine protein phosphatase PrpC